MPQDNSSDLSLIPQLLIVVLLFYVYFQYRKASRKALVQDLALTRQAVLGQMRDKWLVHISAVGFYALWSGISVDKAKWLVREWGSRAEAMAMNDLDKQALWEAIEWWEKWAPRLEEARRKDQS